MGGCSLHFLQKQRRIELAFTPYHIIYPITRALTIPEGALIHFVQPSENTPPSSLALNPVNTHCYPIQKYHRCLSRLHSYN